jgi:pimeloyl-[acyl-carrier protein] methyl ester esterase
VTASGLYIRDEGAGRPIVFVHGWSCPGMFFDRQVADLKDHARCIVPDLPGHGATGDRVPRTIEAAADAIHAYLSEQDLQDVVLCGWSMGALVSYALIERHGADRIGSMIAIDMSPKVLNDEDWLNGTRSGLTVGQNTHFINTITADWQRLPRRIARRMFAADSEPCPGLLDYASGEIAKANPNWLKDMWMSLTALDFRELLRTFPVPFHLAAGAKSQLYSPHVHRWHSENVPDLQLTLFDHSGHAPHLEEPEKFKALMLGEVTR